jgi:hypothetical protein
MTDGERYLTYAPWPGQLNNTRISFETAVVLAFVSRRTLVFPDAYRRLDEPEWRGDQFCPLHPAEFLDLSDLGQVVPMISRQDYAEGTQDGWRHGVCDVSIESGTTVVCCPGDCGDRREDLRAFSAGRNVLPWQVPERDDPRTVNLQDPTLEPFYAFVYFCEPSHSVACRELVRRHVRFLPHIEEIGEQIAGVLGDFDAVHVRRGDFLGQRPDQDVSAGQIAEALSEAGFCSRRLYIASDEGDRGFFQPLAADHELVFADDVLDRASSGIPDEHVACIEQVVCSQARAFVGTRLSTFSSYITRLRGYRGAVDQGIRFTDGGPGDECDDGSEGYSWVNWLRRGYPLWGREYREAWRY